MAQVGYGPLYRVLGPPPERPFATLLDAARVIDEVDEHWLNGVKVYPFPPGPAKPHDPCSTGTLRTKSSDGTVPLPEFGGFSVYLEEQCSSVGIVGPGLTPEQIQERFVGRATAAFAALEPFAVEKEFMSGGALGNNPHLADGNGTFPTGNTAQSVVEAFAILEDLIAATGRRGIIHCTPGILTKAGQQFLVFDERSGEVRTVNGTRVVPGYGYVGNTTPVGHSAPASAKQSWIYATGPVDVRRGEVFVVPERIEAALDRAQNTITFLVERNYVVDWDTVLQAAVLADRGI
jgi:hypothetical protein